MPRTFPGSWNFCGFGVFLFIGGRGKSIFRECGGFGCGMFLAFSATACLLRFLRHRRPRQEPLSRVRLLRLRHVPGDSLGQRPRQVDRPRVRLFRLRHVPCVFGITAVSTAFTSGLSRVRLRRLRHVPGDFLGQRPRQVHRPRVRLLRLRHVLCVFGITAVSTAFTSAAASATACLLHLFTGSLPKEWREASGPWGF